MVQQVKDLALSLQQHGLLLWHGFHTWPGDFFMPWEKHTHTHKKKVRGWRKILHANDKKAGVRTIVSDKEDSKTKVMNRMDYV